MRTTNERPIYVLTLRPEAYCHDPIKALRATLKRALRDTACAASASPSARRWWWRHQAPYPHHRRAGDCDGHRSSARRNQRSRSR